jgi:hypothetical protein
VKILDHLQPNECRYPLKKAWIEGDLQSRLVWWFCSAPCDEGKSFCRACAAVVYRQAEGVPNEEGFAAVLRSLDLPQAGRFLVILLILGFVLSNGGLLNSLLDQLKSVAPPSQLNPNPTAQTKAPLTSTPAPQQPASAIFNPMFGGVH